VASTRCHRRRLCGASIFAAVLALAGASAAQDLNPTIEVRPGTLMAHRVALQRFADLGPGSAALQPETLREALRSGLEFTSSVVTLPDEAFLAPVDTRQLHGARRTDCADWRTSGADVLVEGTLEEQEGRARVQIGVWDVARCLRLLSESYVRPAATMTRHARRIADDIVGAITGTRGASATEIAFISTRVGHREVALMDADGGNARPATSSNSVKAFPAWLPGGGGILYTAYVTGKQPGLYVTARSRSVRAGSLLENVLPGEPKYRGVFDPSGESLALVSSVDGSAEIFRVSRDGRRVKRLTFSPSIEVSPTWSPDGERIAFVSDRSGSPQIFVMNADGTDKRRLTFQGSYNTSPAWSPDGRWIAYQTRLEAQFDIWLIDPTGEVNFPLIEHPRSDESPSWSPDARRIAFSSNRRGNRDIYTIDRTGDRLLRLTRDRGDNTHPVWGPYPE
jgi:TolB protein